MSTNNEAPTVKEIRCYRCLCFLFFDNSTYVHVGSKLNRMDGLSVLGNPHTLALCPYRINRIIIAGFLFDKYLVPFYKKDLFINDIEALSPFYEKGILIGYKE